MDLYSNCYLIYVGTNHTNHHYLCAVSGVQSHHEHTARGIHTCCAAHTAMRRQFHYCVGALLAWGAVS